MSSEKIKRDSKSIESVDKSTYQGDYEATIVEQWKTCVDIANGITDKRNMANSIFITINTALFAVVTFSLDYKSIFLSVIGIAICILWLKLLENYKRLNEVKYDIINEIEDMLPLTPFKAEWNRLNYQGNYTGLTKIEKILPIVFVVLYGMAILYPLAKLILPFVCTCIAN